ncbi:hypothetical protein AAG570_007513 [Ranatra chinensis]|uniref:Uncharacterized protein n=1 Tax=Ranatra chinensis TaxID=642074 RepID=A0ABD0YB79_9HEMI
MGNGSRIESVRSVQSGYVERLCETPPMNERSGALQVSNSLKALECSASRLGVWGVRLVVAGWCGGACLQSTSGTGRVRRPELTERHFLHRRRPRTPVVRVPDRPSPLAPPPTPPHPRRTVADVRGYDWAG